MGNHHNRPQNQKNNAVQPSSANSQLKCPKCNYRMPAGSSIHQVSYIESLVCLTHQKLPQ